MFYLIHGIFFPADYLILLDGRVSYPFRGQFTLFGNNQSQGELSDAYGDSDISHIEVTNDALFFIKHYIRDRDRAITYRFLREGDLWIGEWDDGKDKGWSNCVTTMVHERVYRVPHPEKFALHRPSS